jgi:hypothetical protein
MAIFGQLFYLGVKPLDVNDQSLCFVTEPSLRSIFSDEWVALPLQDMRHFCQVAYSECN